MLLGSTLSVPPAFQDREAHLVSHPDLPSLRPAVRQTDAASRRIGIASWYGGGERLNRHVAMGHRFDPEALEAAMWDVPFGTLVKVTNMENGRSIVVRITDRGPARRFRKRRAIDLTRRAFAEIAPLRQWLVPVVVEQLS